MAQNEIKTRVVADTTQLDKTLGTLKGKIAGAISPSTFSLVSINPWKLAADGIIRASKYIINTFKNAGEELRKYGKTIREEAKDLGAITEDMAAFKAAANAAGVSVQAYADALESIKAGETTLNKQREAWENIAKSSDVAREGARAFAALRLAQEERDKKNFVEAAALDARVKDEDRMRAALDRLARTYGSRGERHALSVQNLDFIQIAKELSIDEETLSRMPAFFYSQQEKYIEKYEEERQKREEREAKTFEERRRRFEEEAKRQQEQEARARALREEWEKIQKETEARVQREKEAAQKTAIRDEESLAREIFSLYESREGLVSVRERRAQLAAHYKTTPERIDELLALGEALTLTTAERFRRETDAISNQQQERKRTEDERARLTERSADLRKRLGEVEGDLDAAWLTSSGGSLIGDGSFSLAMGQRMRAIDRAEKQQELLAELHTNNKLLAEISKKLSE